MRQGNKVFILAGIILMAIGGCYKYDIETIRIDHHVFHVPKKYLVQASIFFLPASQHDGLMFDVNPEAPLRERNLVGIQSTAISCPPRKDLGSSPLATACQAASQKVVMEYGGALEKVYPHPGYTKGWEYRVKDGKSQGAVVLSCSALSDGDGLCGAFGTYSDLIYDVSLNESEISRLPAIRKEIHNLLSSWEKPVTD